MAGKHNRTKGVVKAGLKLSIYGAPGTFKTSFAARMPNPLFIDPTGGSNWLNVDRIHVSHYAHVLSALDDAEKGLLDLNPGDTLVLDEFQEIERMLSAHFCTLHKKKTLGDFGHGKGYFGFRETCAELIRQLGRISHKGINVVVINHSQDKSFSNPEGPDYDKYTATVDRVNWNYLTGWADAVLYFGSKVLVATDRDGKGVGVNKVVESDIFCRGTALFDAKNRWNMPKTIPNDRQATARTLFYVDATTLIGSREIDQHIDGSEHYERGMSDELKARLYVSIKINELIN